MKICQVVHGYPPDERTGVENYTEGLTREFVARGHEVHVFTRRTNPHHADLSRQVEKRRGSFVHWLITNTIPGNATEALEPPGSSREFGRFLDEVRPDVVHFQHVIKLGIGYLDEAHERGIPVVYTTHDFFSICHRFTLLRPDLQNCSARLDSDACARCDRAIELLSGFDLGDFQLGVLPDELTVEQHTELARVLNGEAEFADDSLEVARRELDRLRFEAFRKVDHFISPSRHLADVLIEAGFDAERFEASSNGLDTEDLQALEPSEWQAPEKLRLGFFGGLSKHKGVQDLLEAFDGLQDVCELTIHGYTTDADHLARLQGLAERVGATMAGSYHRDDIADLYRSIDAIVVPSIWSENQPLVIQEAFAAHRPVVTANYGALPENVTDGVDGLLFEAGDVESMRATLRRLATEDGLYAKLAGGAKTPKSVAEQALELERLYARLSRRAKDAREASREALPASLREPARRFDRLSDLPSEELVRRAFDGLDRLARFVGSTDQRALISEALAQPLPARDELEDLQRSNQWLERGRESLEQELEWRRCAMEDQRKAIDDQRQEIDWVQGIVARAKEGADELKETTERLKDEITRQGLDPRGLEQAMGWIDGDVGAAGGVAKAIIDAQWQIFHKAVEPLAGILLSETGELEDPMESLKVAGSHIDGLVNTLTQARIEAEVQLQRIEQLEAQVADQAAENDGLRHDLADLLLERDTLRRECDWRASEMDYVRRKLTQSSLKYVLGRSKLAKQVSTWSELTAEDAE